jgi:ribosomal protein S18 acetylase RimI-like enzyme
MERTQQRSESVLCHPLTESDAGGAARLYADTFLSDEPTTHRRAPDPVLFLHYGTLYARSLAGKQLSFIARDARTPDPAGFIFCVDLTDDLVAEGAWMAEFLAQFPEAVAMLTELEDRFFNRADIVPGSVMHIYQIGVDRRYRGTGIARDLIRRALAHARDRGYRQAVADCTHMASRRSFEACGFREAGFLSYETFSINGVRYFAGLEGGISLMVRDL